MESYVEKCYRKKKQQVDESKVKILQKFFRSVIKPRVDNEKAKTDFYAKLLDYLNAKKSTTAYRKFLKENPDFDRDTLDKITSSQKAMDFYPTPERCLDYEPITNCINTSTHILEPTAGLGSMIHFIDKHKSGKTKVDANELNHSFVPILEKFFPKANITQKNFLDDFSTKNDYDLIVCNPPFSIGNDKKAYLDFLFKCIYMLNTSSSRGEKCLIFICPPLVDKERNWKAGEFNGFDFRDAMKKIPFDRMNKLSKMLQEKELDKKQYKAFQKGEDYEDMEMMMPYQSEWVDECKGFGGTGITADVYKFILT